MSIGEEGEGNGASIGEEGEGNGPSIGEEGEGNLKLLERKERGLCDKCDPVWVSNTAMHLQSQSVAKQSTSHNKHQLHVIPSPYSKHCHSLGLVTIRGHGVQRM